MKVAVRMIAGGDFAQAGAATSHLKGLLKKINIHPADLRRVIIAAFESEMNVVIHARHGSMRAVIDTDEIEVEVRDEGPGIPDIELAMKEGYSTAPPAARQLGYGAGLGLPNIKKNTDLFELTSVVGQGTRLLYTVRFRALAAASAGQHSLRVVAGRCTQCLACMRACPTRAVRVHRGRPEIIGELCVDCTDCLAACPSGAIALAETTAEVRPAGSAVLVVPPAFLAQFSPGIRPARVLATLDRLGFGSVMTTLPWEMALRAAVDRYLAEESPALPVISPVCPAVVNLIALRFPALIEHLAPLLSPMAAMQRELGPRAIAAVVSCPAQLTMLAAGRVSSGFTMITPSTLRHLVQPLAMEQEEPAPESPRGENAPGRGVLKITGFRHVIAALERIENGRLRDVRVLEPFGCDLGCFGSPLHTEDPYVALYRFRRSGLGETEPARAFRRDQPPAPRPGMRLAPDVSVAIAKLAEAEDIAKALPGKDCGLCGAPTCATLAEDVVLNRAGRHDCPYLVNGEARS
jgi:anti-sigma regulatory factor (Ser/Thr protein kinase)/NAD-dependent dihydropyrimidine dehydrogenase PreA subunit